MQHDIAAVLDRAAERRAGNGIVHDDGHAVRVRHIGDGLQIGNVAGRVANRLTEDGRGFVVYQFRQGVRTVIIGEAHINAELGQHVPEQRPGPAIELWHGDDIVADLGQIDDGIIDRGLPG